MLYGDGAVGGAVNIVTRPGASLGGGEVRAAAGSFGLREAAMSVHQRAAVYSVAADISGVWFRGARENNELRHRGAGIEVSGFGNRGEWFATFGMDDQHLGLPGARKVTATSSQVADNPYGATTPDDYADQSGWRVTAGLSRKLDAGATLAAGAELRVKAQDSVLISPFGTAFNTTTNTRLTTFSVTPRVEFGSGVGGLDFTYSDYNQIARSGTGAVPKHRYDLNQYSLAAYVQDTFTVRPDTDVSLGARVQHLRFTGGDILDPHAVVDFLGDPFDGHRESESITDTAWAAHAGVEHDLDDSWTVFARAGRSFRVPSGRTGAFRRHVRLLRVVGADVVGRRGRRSLAEPPRRGAGQCVADGSRE